MDDLKCYKTLKKEDIKNDAENWEFAPILVSCNRE